MIFSLERQQRWRKERASGREHIRSRLRKVSAYSEAWDKMDLSNEAPRPRMSNRKLTPAAREFREAALANLTKLRQDCCRAGAGGENFSTAHGKVRYMQITLFQSFFHDDEIVFHPCVAAAKTCVPGFPFRDCDAELRHFTVQEAYATGHIEKALHLFQSFSSQAVNFGSVLFSHFSSCCTVPLAYS